MSNQTRIPDQFHFFESAHTMKSTPSAKSSTGPLRAWAFTLLIAISAAHPALCQAANTTPAAQLQRWTQEAGQPGNATRGQIFFTSRHGGEWSCASCHNAPPITQGKHANTGKTIAPLAPAFNAKAFTDASKTDKWFRRNCRDVLGRECTAIEKADILAFLFGIQP